MASNAIPNRPRVMDIFKGLSETQLGPSLNDPLASNLYLADLHVDTLLRSVGLQQYQSLICDNSWSFVSDLTVEALWKLGMRNADDALKLHGCFEKFFDNFDSSSSSVTRKVLPFDDIGCKHIMKEMNDSIVKHANNAGGVFSKYNFEKVEILINDKLTGEYGLRKEDQSKKRNGKVNEQWLYHGSVFAESIVNSGFDVTLANKDSYFGSGLYFTNYSSKANRFVFGGENGCPKHNDVSCYVCPRKMIKSRVLLGKALNCSKKTHFCRAPRKHDSVYGVPTDNTTGLEHEEFVVYENDMVQPGFLITYRIARPDASEKI